MPPCRMCRSNCSAAELTSICHKSDNHSIWCNTCIAGIIEKAPKNAPVIARCQLCNSENVIEYNYDQELVKTDKVTYVNGQIDGIFREYYDAERTQVMYEAEYKQGKVDGYFKEYDQETGCLLAILNYVDDMMDGVQMYYNDLFEDGEHGVAKEAAYQMGIRQGATTYYARNSARYAQNNKGKREYTEEQLGRIYKIEFYKDGKLDGQTTTYYIHNNKKIPKKQESYKNGELHGEVITYDEGGNEVTRVEYCEGKIHTGKFEETAKIRVEGDAEDIDVIFSGSRLNGGLEGDVIYYRMNGEKQQVYLREFYENGYKSGKSIYYNHHGSVVKEETYKEGSLHGDVVTYRYSSKLSGIKIRSPEEAKKAAAAATTATASASAGAGAGMSNGYKTYDELMKEKEELLAKIAAEEAAKPGSMGNFSSSGGFGSIGGDGDGKISGVSFSSKMGFGF